jgi:YbbR domain-containing protein
MIRHNWRYKVLAILVALILWFYANSERNPQSRQTFAVPVRVVSVAAGRAAEVLTPKVSVTIQGLKTVVDTVSRDDIEASINLTGLPTDRKVVKTNVPVTVRLPRAVESDLTVSVKPDSARVQVEAVEARRMAVDVYFTSQPPLGYSYSSPLLTPGAVDVSGRVSQLARVKQAILTVSEDAAASSTEDYYEVTAVDAKGNAVAEVKVRPTKVKAKLEMVEAPATRAAMVSPLFDGEPKFPLRVTRYTVTPSSVTLEGKPSTLSGISAVETEKISLEGVDATVTREVALQVPRGTRVSGGRTVRVTIYVGAQ